MPDKVFLVFTEHTVSSKRKTAIYDVHGTNNVLIGQIRWFSAWRRYVFQPVGGVVVDAMCLLELQYKLVDLMGTRKSTAE